LPRMLLELLNCAGGPVLLPRRAAESPDAGPAAALAAASRQVEAQRQSSPLARRVAAPAAQSCAPARRAVGTETHRETVIVNESLCGSIKPVRLRRTPPLFPGPKQDPGPPGKGNSPPGRARSPPACPQPARQRHNPAKIAAGAIENGGRIGPRPVPPSAPGGATAARSPPSTPPQPRPDPGRSSDCGTAAPAYARLSAP